MPKEHADRLAELGAFIREQRENARLSVRRLSELADVSNPYLSQIERGLRRPSAEILQQIARGLKISAETLYVQAGILEPGTGETDLAREILADAHLNEEQKQALIRIYLSFRHENEMRPEHDDPSGAGSPRRGAPSETPADMAAVDEMVAGPAETSAGV